MLYFYFNSTQYTLKSSLVAQWGKDLAGQVAAAVAWIATVWPWEHLHAAGMAKGKKEKKRHLT